MVLALLYGAYARKQDARLEAYRAEIRQILAQKTEADLREESVPESDNAAAIYSQIFRLAAGSRVDDPDMYPEFELIPEGDLFRKTPFPASASSTQQATILKVYHSATVAQILSLCQEVAKRPHCHFIDAKNGSGEIPMIRLKWALMNFAEIAAYQQEWNKAHEYLLAAFLCELHQNDYGTSWPNRIFSCLRTLPQPSASQKHKWRSALTAFAPKNPCRTRIRARVVSALNPNWPNHLHREFGLKPPFYEVSRFLWGWSMPLRQDEASRCLSYFVPILQWAEKPDDWTVLPDPRKSIPRRWWSCFPGKFHGPDWVESMVSWENQRRQALCALAIGDYQESHEGRLPKSLSELSTLAPKLATEASSGSPWNYIRNDNGTFTLQATTGTTPSWTSTTARISGN
jgi:hypothetical protein